MNRKYAYLGIVAIVASIIGIVSATTVEEVQAQTLNPTHPDVQKLSPKSFGSSNTQVCGDRLCSEAVSVIDIEEDTPIGSISGESSSAPTAKLISIAKYKSAPYADISGISYKITFSLKAGDTNLRDIQIHVQSDVDSFEFGVSSLAAMKSSVNVIRVHAIDPDSITGEIVGYSLTGPTGSGPR